MNTKGFTLVELIAVIVILSLLALITSTAVTKLVSDAKDDLSQTQIALIKSAAETWMADNLTYLPDTGECSYLTLEDLKSYGLLDSNVLDPKNNQEISDDLKIKISTTLSKYGNPVRNVEVNPKNIDGCSRIFKKYNNNIIIEATNNWISGNSNKLPSSGNSAYLTIGDLIRSGYITIESLQSDEEEYELPSEDLKIKITKDYDNKIDIEVNPRTIEGSNIIYKHTCTMTNGNKKIEIGDEITCGTENFYVVSFNQNSINMLAKYNIDISENPRQSTSAGKIGFSNDVYWLKDYFVNTYGTDFVYDYNSYLYKYVNLYQTFLRNTIEGASATIMSKNIFDKIKSYNWATNTEYWLGTYKDYNVTSYDDYVPSGSQIDCANSGGEWYELSSNHTYCIFTYYNYEVLMYTNKGTAGFKTTKPYSADLSVLRGSFTCDTTGIRPIITISTIEL